MLSFARAALAAMLLALGGNPVPAAHTSATAPAPPTTLTVVAHEDDDILFINPEVSRDISAGRRMVTVFVTAGDAGKPTAYWRGRERGAMAAYASMAGAADRWTMRRVAVGGHSLLRATLTGKPVSLFFLRLPDGHGYAKHRFETIRDLWKGTMTTVRAIDGTATYTKESLTGTLTAIMNAYRPGVIRTLDYAGHYGDGDHSDHYTAAYFTLAAHRAYRSVHTLTGYAGYPMETRPANLPTAVRDAKLRYFLAYAPHDDHVCDTRRPGMGDPR